MYISIIDYVEMAHASFTTLSDKTYVQYRFPFFPYIYLCTAKAVLPFAHRYSQARAEIHIQLLTGCSILYMPYNLRHGTHTFNCALTQYMFVYSFSSLSPVLCHNFLTRHATTIIKISVSDNYSACYNV